MRRLRILCFVAASTVLLRDAPLSADASSGAAYLVIVNPAHSTERTERDFLADAFLKKVTKWRDGDAIRPVDLSSNSPIRRRFTEDVLKRSVQAVKSYWQQHIFAGRDLPPPELETDEDVVSYVLKHPGAVGYVSAAAELHGTKIVSVQ